MIHAYALVNVRMYMQSMKEEYTNGEIKVSQIKLIEREIALLHVLHKVKITQLNSFSVVCFHPKKLLLETTIFSI